MSRVGSAHSARVTMAWLSPRYVVYALGGMYTHDLDANEAYHVLTDEWFRLSPMPSARQARHRGRNVILMRLCVPLAILCT
jgi:hypothetical protein